MNSKSRNYLSDKFNTEGKYLKILGRNKNFWIILVIDIVFIIFALFASFSIRFENNLGTLEMRQFIGLIPLMVFVKIIFLYIFGLYKGMWRYMSTGDLLNILKACVSAAGVTLVILLYFNRFSGLSRSVFILDTLFTFLFVTGHRISIRFYYKNANGGKKFPYDSDNRRKIKKLLLIGAGDAAEKVLRELKENNQLSYIAVGLLDDNSKKIGMKIHGVPVVGVIDELKENVDKFNADEVLITIASITAMNMKRIVGACQASSIRYKVLPGMSELIDGKISIKNIRDIDYRDLLGRKEVKLDMDQIGGYLSDKVVLITGAGGSIGSELCRQLMSFTPSKIILFDSSEENLYSIQMELLHDFQYLDIVPVLGKIQDLPLLCKVFSDNYPSVIFHAAAYKHVPIVENNPWQAIDNNICATQILLEAAIIFGADRFVLVSTDKAVRPTSIMGASKRFTELLMHAYSKKHWDGYLSNHWKQNDLSNFVDSRFEEAFTQLPIFMAVRFGNVLGSSGSVIPLFKRQIEKGGPLTVTHPEITRYFMSIDEAAQLIIQAGSMGTEGGEIFILKMGEPIKIAQMAEDLVKLAGKDVGTDIDIVFTGLREGEKLYEELITEGEGIVNTSHEKIMVLVGNNTQSCRDLSQIVQLISNKKDIYDPQFIKKSLVDVIPEYTPISM